MIIDIICQFMCGLIINTTANISPRHPLQKTLLTVMGMGLYNQMMRKEMGV